MVTDVDGTRALNACILFLPQLHGRAVRTVEGLTGPNGEIHPVQAAMVDHHGSQCGFCTPGFVMSLYALWMQNPDPDDAAQLAGTPFEHMPDDPGTTPLSHPERANVVFVVAASQVGQVLTVAAPSGARPATTTPA